MAERKQIGSSAARKRRVGPTAPLQREVIVSTALALVDREGLQALSMRRLGAALGVDPMAVYYHLPSKQALLDAIVEAVMAGIDLSVDNPQTLPSSAFYVRRALTGMRCWRMPTRCPLSWRTARRRPPPCGQWSGSSASCATPGCRPPRHLRACR